MSSVTDRQLLTLDAPSGDRLSVRQRWLVFGLIVLMIAAGLPLTYRHYQAGQPTAVEIARTEAVAAYLASNPMLEGHRLVITDVRVEFQNETNGYYLFFDTTLTIADLAFADGIYAHFDQFKFGHPELELGRVIILDDSGNYLTGGAA